MAGAGLPISIIFMLYSKYNIDLSIYVFVGSMFCLWICGSRLYLGMHSLLDVIAGILYSILIIITLLPVLETIDLFLLENKYSPMITFITGYLICYFYPSLKPNHWSTARGDTISITGSAIGFSIGSYISNYLGYLKISNDIIQMPNDYLDYLLIFTRTILGLSSLIATSILVKAIVLKCVCKIYKCDIKDPTIKKQKRVELNYNYFSYIAIGANIAFIAPVMFQSLGIHRN